MDYEVRLLIWNANSKEEAEQAVNEMFLTYDYSVHTCCQVGHKRALLFYPHVQFADVNVFCHFLYNLMFITFNSSPHTN